MAQQIQGGGVAGSSSASAARGMALMNQSSSSLAETLQNAQKIALDKRKQAEAEYTNAYNTFIARQQESGLPLNLYVSGHENEFAQLQAMKAKVYGGSPTDIAQQTSDITDIRNMTPSQLQTAKLNEAYRRGLVPGGGQQPPSQPSVATDQSTPTVAVPSANTQPTVNVSQTPPSAPQPQPQANAPQTPTKGIATAPQIAYNLDTTLALSADIMLERTKKALNNAYVEKNALVEQLFSLNQTLASNPRANPSDIRAKATLESKISKANAEIERQRQNMNMYQKQSGLISGNQGISPSRTPDSNVIPAVSPEAKKTEQTFVMAPQKARTTQAKTVAQQAVDTYANDSDVQVAKQILANPEGKAYLADAMRRTADGTATEQDAALRRGVIKLEYAKAEASNPEKSAQLARQSAEAGNAYAKAQSRKQNDTSSGAEMELLQASKKVGNVLKALESTTTPALQQMLDNEMEFIKQDQVALEAYGMTDLANRRANQAVIDAQYGMIEQQKKFKLVEELGKANADAMKAHADILGNLAKVADVWQNHVAQFKGDEGKAKTAAPALFAAWTSAQKQAELATGGAYKARYFDSVDGRNFIQKLIGSGGPTMTEVDSSAEMLGLIAPPSAGGSQTDTQRKAADILVKHQ